VTRRSSAEVRARILRRARAAVESFPRKVRLASHAENKQGLIDHVWSLIAKVDPYNRELLTIYFNGHIRNEAENVIDLTNE
jgi:hypothetical protein